MVDPDFADKVKEVLRDTLGLPPEFVSYMHDHQLVHGRVNESNLGFSDTTARDATTEQHGLLPKLSGSSSDVLKGDGTYGPGGSGGGIGATSLIYRYTVTGADKASINTLTDTPDAGSNDWTNGDLLEVYWTARTDDAGATSVVNIQVATGGVLDTGGSYVAELMQAVNTTITGGPGSTTQWGFNCHGSGGSATYASATQLTIPNYSGTTLFKAGVSLTARNDGTAANTLVDHRALIWISTSAINGLKLFATGTAKLKVGTQLLIYKRTAS